jgi:hypothetical protein
MCHTGRKERSVVPTAKLYVMEVELKSSRHDTMCHIVYTMHHYQKLLSKNCSNSTHCIMISISFGGFLCSYILWIITFDVDVCIFRS